MWGRVRRALRGIPGSLLNSPSLSSLVPGRAPVRHGPRLQGRFLVAVDLLVIALACYLALALRFDRISAPLSVPAFPAVVVVLLATRTIVDHRLGLYSRRWRNASVADMERIAGAVAIGTLLSLTVFYVTASAADDQAALAFPHSFWLIEALLSVAFLGGIRFGIRAAAEHAQESTVSSQNGNAALLYGAGEAGALLARSARRHPEAAIRPVGFLDDDPSLAGSSVAGLRVFGGLDMMERAVAETGAHRLLISMPSAPGSAVRPILEAALALKLEVRTVPAFEALLDGSVDAFRVRQVRVEDLLRRPMVTEHADGVEALLRDRSVLITGAGGSIGSELARQVFATGPRRLILVDRAESPLYLLQRELESHRRKEYGSGEVVVHLANVASRVEMDRFVAREQPSIIFHAAAFKHVPLMEAHPSDAAHVNIGGTMVMLDAALGAGVERFVFVSTDKAVRPSSVMGASKRIAEMLVADAADRSGLPYVSVRFGNVLGSNGSVVPIFREQLENGEPLTVTHADMTRYFMTIPEAAWLILDAAALGGTGDLFVLDMGEPIRIVDLARDLVRLAGRDPDSQPIEIVGLRPGEKLHEELFYDAEHVEPTSSAKVLRALTPPPPPTIRDDARRIVAMATGADETAVGAAILELANRAGAPSPAVVPAAPPRRQRKVVVRHEPVEEVVAGGPGT